MQVRVSYQYADRSDAMVLFLQDFYRICRKESTTGQTTPHTGRIPYLLACTTDSKYTGIEEGSKGPQ